MAKTKEIKMTGFIEWAKIFTQNMDDNMEFHEKTQGQFNMNFYPESDEEFETFFKAGAPTSSMGNDTIKQGNEELGMGKYIRLKRPNVHPSGIEDFGGAPKVYDYTDGPSLNLWDYETQGNLGNGTKVIAKATIYGEGARASIRLEAVAVLDHVKYEGGDKSAGF